MGTPPPAGQTIEEVATSVVAVSKAVLFEDEFLLYAEVSLELPLPVFPSDGQPAVPSQCLWSVLIVNHDWGSLLIGEQISEWTYDYALEGSNLTVTMFGNTGMTSLSRTPGLWMCLKVWSRSSLERCPG